MLRANGHLGVLLGRKKRVLSLRGLGTIHTWHGVSDVEISICSAKEWEKYLVITNGAIPKTVAKGFCHSSDLDS